jgi:putative colanic acid biosynthesis acetyltransferase WcaF
VHLDSFDSSSFNRGAPRHVEAFWLFIGSPLLSSQLPGSFWRRGLLRFFGALVGVGVIIKPRVRVKFPWRLELGEHCWVGEDVWIDNLAHVRLGANSCISQGCYLCTGSHDWNKDTFDLFVAKIDIGAHAWVGARCNIAPGTTVGEGVVIALGSTAKGDLIPWTRYAGHFAAPVGIRSTDSRERR